MKDWHWFVVFAVILITPFLPSILKSKCPGCSKRKIEKLNTLRVMQEGDTYTYLTFYHCHACNGFFKQVRSGSFETSSGDEYKITQEASLHGS